LVAGPLPLFERGTVRTWRIAALRAGRCAGGCAAEPSGARLALNRQGWGSKGYAFFAALQKRGCREPLQCA
jgi:hypothetical protein